MIFSENRYPLFGIMLCAGKAARDEGRGIMQKSFIRGARQEQRAYSPAVITQGAGRIIWLAGQGGHVADDGKLLAGDFEAQCRQAFRNIEKTLAAAGAKLSDMVTMTVFLIDARHTTRMTEIRREIFGSDFPASAAITVAGFAVPDMMIEIQGIAVAE
jgi:2-iminobutanoate/2-iminopropanoate deaminase